MEVMAQYEPKTAKRVYLYRNGIATKDAKMMVVNDRQIRDFSTFLTRVTSGLKAPVAIRNIYTPSGGHRVKTLGDLRAGQHYVASGSEQFRKVKYGGQRLLPRRQPRTEFSVPSRTHQAVVASARYRRPIEKPFVIHVFRNGDEQFRGVRILLARRIMSSWEHVLEQITEKAELFTPAKRLCTIDGQTVHAVSELQDGNKYVALEGTKTFQKVAYCASEEKRTLSTFPRVPIRLHGVRRRATHHVLAAREREKPSFVATGGGPTVEGAAVLKRERRKSRPMAGRKNKEAREKAVQDHREDSIFGGSPSHLQESFTTEMPSPPAVRKLKKHHPQPKSGTATPKYSTNMPKKTKQKPATKREEVRESLDSTSGADSPVVASTTAAAVVEDLSASTASVGKGSGTGVFRASDKPKTESPHEEYVEDPQGETVFKSQNGEAEDAQTVEESRDLEVERPLDHEEAKEVVEEVPEQEEPAAGTELKVEPTQGTLVPPLTTTATTVHQSTDDESVKEVENSTKDEAEASVHTSSRPPSEPAEVPMASEKNSRTSSTTLNKRDKASDGDLEPNTGDQDIPEEVEAELKSSTPDPVDDATSINKSVEGGDELSASQHEGDITEEVIEEEQVAPIEEDIEAGNTGTTPETSSPKPQSRKESKVSSSDAATPLPPAEDDEVATEEIIEEEGEGKQSQGEPTTQSTGHEDTASTTSSANKTIAKEEDDDNDTTTFVIADPPEEQP